MTTPTDPGLDAAIQRVEKALDEQIGWINFNTEHVEALARAAREDVAGTVREARKGARRCDKLHVHSALNPFRMTCPCGCRFNPWTGKPDD